MSDTHTHRKALAQLAAGDWAGAHRLTQELDDHLAAWLHAHLHRVEGDLGNAAYWYHRAGMESRADDLKTEFKDLERVCAAS
jgi:hypothetical protein